MNIKTDTFAVNASKAVSFSSPSMTHNGINIGDTHIHFVKQMIFGGTKSETPQ
jgi:hypothetical protein